VVLVAFSQSQLCHLRIESLHPDVAKKRSQSAFSLANLCSSGCYNFAKNQNS
jgi:hypothetical protein